MKTLLSSLFMLSLLLFSVKGKVNGSPTGEAVRPENGQAVQIYSSPELVELSGHWISDFEKSNPGAKLVLHEAVDASQIQEGRIWLTSASIEDEPSWKMVIGHDIVVPVFNAKNPLFEKLNERGFTSEDFTKILSDNASLSALLGEGNSVPVSAYVADNSQVISGVSGFAGIDAETV